ncbi:MMPL family transporter [Paenibacillus sp. B01]|uniref:MMPL family transporter n=1 Tax=Paenibacillus sp. B01 TaxID=2660554 RepID=UPI00129B1C59|nr:MMPL family transporter [Paenibacillus sp. B01]QGG58217.1 MMPL family transporter [Paenibacillus sp. B01]
MAKRGSWIAWATTRRGRWITLGAWVAVAALLMLLLPGVRSQADSNAPNFDESKPSVQAEKLLAEQFRSEEGTPALVVWHREGGLSQDDLKAISAVSADVAASPLPGQRSSLPLHELPPPALAAQLSEDGSTLVWPVVFQPDAPTEEIKQGVEQLRERTEKIAGTPAFEADTADGAELSARLTGPAGISVDATELFSSADVSLMIATVLLVLVFLLAIYRSPVLALIPLVAVGFAYAVTDPLLGYMASKDWIDVDSQAVAIMTVLLFGAGTDYCLFLVSRYRELLAEERSPAAALRAALGSSGGAIAMSGLTVVIALLTLLLAQYGVIKRFAVPFGLSILVMALSSLTLLPALLSIFGRGSFWPFVPRTPEMAEERARRKGKPAPKRTGRRGPGFTGRLVVRRPWTVTLVSVALLGVLALFSTQVKFTFDILSSFPEEMESRQGFALIGDNFSEGTLAPVTVMAQGEAGAIPPVAEKLQALGSVAKVGEPAEAASQPGLRAWKVELAMNPYSQEAMDALPAIREAAEQAIGGADAADRVWLAGQTAVQYDTREAEAVDQQVIIPLVIVLIAALLLVYLRSVTAMVYLIGTVILSYFAALGLGWLVLHEPMGVDAIQGAIPLYAFVFLVALGEDYNIFMVSSIWKKRRKMPLKQAIAEGVSETGPVITSAGLILAGTFAVLATLPIQVLLQFGLITALGVLLDTFVVRPYLVPALTALLGRRAFWPGELSRVPEDEVPAGGELVKASAERSLNK